MKSVYNNKLVISYYAILLFTTIAAIGFYFIQNNGLLAGGQIALPKLVWLALAILFWFFMPILFLLDDRVALRWRQVYLIFIINMLLRAIIELFMMYISKNWDPYYGIGHDVFTIVLLGLLLIRTPGNLKDNILFGFTVILLMMFVTEILFVFYMLFQVSGKESVVYFVPGDDSHLGIMIITWIVVTFLAIYLLSFSRRWLRGEFIRAGS